MQITKELLDALGKDWKDISIREIEQGCILIIIFNNKDAANTFLRIIENNEFKIQVIINSKKEYVLQFSFSSNGDNFVFGINTDRTSEKYPPLEWLLQPLKVNLLTTGVWISRGNSNINSNYFPVVNNIFLN